MLIVSYYTPDYAEHAARLRASCEQFAYRYWIEAVEDRGKWVHNCAAKGAFVLRALRATGESVLWLDADAEIRSNISEMVPMRPLDFAIHHEENRSPKWSFRSGTVWFNSTPAAHRLAEDWDRRCEEAPDRFDQESLYLAWHGMGQAINVRAHWLPMSYCQRIGEPDHKDEDAHILHYQASRETRKKRAGRMG